MTRTINPLHFEDLDPHRFEDLVRQLIYDFKEWQSLEATGRQGSDDGFDARARERIKDEQDDDEDDENEEKVREILDEKIWLIQCKREKQITPKKIANYASEIAKQATGLYGVIFVAACDFSKKTRDVFLQELRNSGIQEVHLWGKAELEDMLFQPKNDQLLFAYFGISLQIRKRTLKTQIRSKLSMKRKVFRVFGESRQMHKSVLIRDANDKEYPHEERIKDFEKLPKWKGFTLVDYYYDGLCILVRSYFAYIADDRIHWDYCDKIENKAVIHGYKNDKRSPKDQERDKVWNFWYYKIPEQNRANFNIVYFIPYDRIIDIDEKGDEYYECSHIYVPFEGQLGPFEPRYCHEYVEPSGRFAGMGCQPKDENRIKFFPDKFPDVETYKDEIEKRIGKTT